MLVLARKLNESIIIGDDIEVVVIDIKGDQVKLGISAPKRISVHRKEIYDEIQQENIAAMSSNLKPETLKNLSDFLSGGPKEDGASKDGPGTGEKGKS
ncbi:MAG TPA: carbon storage regulator CsrA [Spirochaetota bacterium]|nr:carbon storage regulator CsrA [Spirochaetota bacterium]HNU92995.1 carbon storage regulator CsrA [Spirochaetota bacterium]HPV98832.1 carbon storage regulator CsrA [Spirochaetota bacterium]